MKLTDLPLVGALFNDVPGPYLPKLTPLWKLHHVLRGSYGVAVRRLHARYGPLVQTGPNEYSLSDKEFVYVRRLRRSSHPLAPSSLEALQRSLSMENLHRNESLIDACTTKLLRILSNAAEEGHNVQVSQLLARYAYDLMFALTTGQAASFLDLAPDGEAVASALENWKFYAVLYGSYLRYHPFIASVLSAVGFSDGGYSKVFNSHSTRGDNGTENADGADDGTTQFKRPDLEARIALTLAGADPVVTLTGKMLRHVYDDRQLLARLRAEIAVAGLSPRPSFTELLLRKLSLPLLYATILETARLCETTRPTFTTKEHGVQVAEVQMAKNQTISFETTIAHVDPATFGPDAHEWQPIRWLNAALAPEMKRHLLAYNLSTDNNTIETTHIFAAAKLITAVIAHFDITSHTQDTECSYIMHYQGFPSKQSSTPSDDQWLTSSDIVGLTLNDISVLEDVLPKHDVQKLLTGELATFNTKFDPKATIITAPIPLRRTRYLIHKAVETAWLGRLEHRTSRDDRMAIGPAQGMPRAFRRQPPRKGAQQLSGKAEVQRPPRNHVSSQVPAARRPPPTVVGGWGKFINEATSLSNYAKSDAGYAERVKSIEKAHDDLNAAAAAAEAAGERPAFLNTYHETFIKRDTSKKSDITAKKAPTDTGNDAAADVKAEKTNDASATTTAEPTMLPPHLRKKAADAKSTDTKADG